MRKMNTIKIHLVVTLTFLFAQILNTSGYMVGNNPYRRREVIDPLGKYHVEYLVDLPAQRITFNVTVETRGYVGFGLNRNGNMLNADIVIGGVTQNGEIYFSDRHGIGNSQPPLDTHQDWDLNSGFENATHTFLSFSRNLDTCDPQDHPITEDKVSIIWAYGARDNEITYHHEHRGVYEVYLLHPDYSPLIVRGSSGEPTGIADRPDVRVWTLSNRLMLPEAETTYWCLIFKAPQLQRKHHVIGFDIRFPDEASRRHSHHLLVHKCNAPRGRDGKSVFESFVTPKHRGQQCLMAKSPTGPMPTEYCTEFFSSWAVGGRAYFLPPSAGIPFGSDTEEYYMLQIHFDNPNNLQNQEVEIHIDYFYTEMLRPNDAGMMIYRHESPGLTPSILIPPYTVNHHTYGLCGSECTKRFIPPEGIFLDGLLLHTHTSGRRVKFQHFRNGKELPWIASDDNYSFNYQQVRSLSEARHVLPGDKLVANCVYDNSRINETVVGGFSTQQEMCAVVVFYHNKIPAYQQCSSEIDSPDYREYFLGVRNISWSYPDLEFVVDPPHELAGLTISEVSDNFVDWTLERREALEKFHLLHPHINRCPQELYSLKGYRALSNGRSENSEDSGIPVSFPAEVTPYEPERTCSFSKNNNY